MTTKIIIVDPRESRPVWNNFIKTLIDSHGAVTYDNIMEALAEHRADLIHDSLGSPSLEFENDEDAIRFMLLYS